MKLIIEKIDPNELEIISESKKNNVKKLYITGPFLRSECVNGNKRKYPRHIMEREVERYSNVYVNENRAFGELDHPETPKVNLKNVSHRIVELKQDGNDFIGKAIIMDTPSGIIAQKIMESGGRLGVSSRGVGSLKECDGVNIVQDDFHLATAADIVSDPSAPGAFVNGIMENKEWMYDIGVWREEEIEKARKSIMEASKADLEYKILESFNKLMSKL